MNKIDQGLIPKTNKDNKKKLVALKTALCWEDQLFNRD